MPIVDIPPDRPAQFTAESGNDWARAKPGQWFIGVIETSSNQGSLAPVNVFGDRAGQLDEDVKNNLSARGMNRYASGAPGEREGRSIEPDFLRNRGPLTHHMALALHERYDVGSSLGFTLIKYTRTFEDEPEFALFKGTSTSLNSNSTDAVVTHSFARETHARALQMVPADRPGRFGRIFSRLRSIFSNRRGGFRRAGDKVPIEGNYPTSAQLPIAWRDHIVSSLKAREGHLIIPNISVSND